jgi:hypothetical protein
MATSAAQQATNTASNDLHFVRRLSEQAWLARVGGERSELSDASRQSQERNAQAHRTTSGRRHPMATRQLWGRNGEAALAQGVAALRANLRVAGPQSIDALLAAEDVLQRHVLLTELVSLLQPDDPHWGPIEQRISAIERDEGEALQALRNASAAFTPEGDDPRAQSEATALRRTYAAFADHHVPGRETALTPLQIARGLLTDVGPAEFEANLARLQHGAALDLSSPHRSRAAPAAHMALSQSGAFRQVSDVLRAFSDLRTSMPAQSGRHLRAAGPAVDAVLQNIDGGAGDAKAWCGAVCSQDAVERIQADFLSLRALRRFVADLPDSLWNTAAQRASALGALDQAMPLVGHSSLEDKQKSQLQTGMAAAGAA